ncbi:hypothetical protein HS088_TW21G01111 [Tripterygium wilfordii]|uniref:At1g61320/AtMIF1 LRR domain-containing protein n=1 Tax=Tripterygium wilfordii TaxID=458696 RepID=A0A7J7C4U3_TRIWF|nr:hypothetical protein HS088_TW21G01111 [Tripterygium wilfordii]
MVDYWVNISLSKEVEELELNFALAFTPYTLPPNLLDSESLRILKLTNCHLHIPSQLTGLGFLNTIILKIVNVTEEFIQELFKNCLFLENMGLTRCRGITHLKIFAGNLKRFKWLKVENCHKIVKMHIDAPTLCTMYYSGDLEAFTMGNLLRLKDVTLKIDKEGFFPFIGIEKFMFAISHVHVLTTTSKFVKGLSPRLVDRNLEEVLPFCFWNLRELELFMNGSLCGPFNVVTFLNKCHCLEKVTINDKSCVRKEELMAKNIKYIKCHKSQSHFHALPCIHSIRKWARKVKVSMDAMEDNYVENLWQQA